MAISIRRAMSAKRKAQIKLWQAKGAASRKRAAKKAFAQEYRQSRAFGSSKKDSVQWGLAAATKVNPKYGIKKARAIAIGFSKKQSGKSKVSAAIRAKVQRKAYMYNVARFSKHSSIKNKYSKM